MRLGVCADFASAEILAQNGFDYLEGAASQVAALDDAGFADLRRAAEASPIPFEAFNLMVPASVRLTGPEAEDAIIGDYLKRMLPRIAALGAQVVVFGSGGARNLPEGFPRDAARAQLIAFLLRAGDIAAKHGITIAIEPLNTGESNILNSVAEAAGMADAVAHPAVRVLADLYHIAREGQSLEEIVAAGARMAHVHVIQPDERYYPKPSDGYDYTPFFGALKAAGYAGRMSIEGRYEGDLGEALSAAYAVLHPLTASS